METGQFHPVLRGARLERDLSEREETLLFSLLPPERKARLERAAASSGRREVLCVYGLLRLSLRQCLNWQRWPDIQTGPYGKPFFPAYPGIHFSLSHTAGAVLAGLAGQPLGVDIERIRPVRERILRRTTGYTVTAEEFFRRWVYAESTGKRTGRGVGPVLRRGLAVPPEGEPYHSYRPFPGYVAGAALSPGDAVPGAVEWIPGVSPLLEAIERELFP